MQQSDQIECLHQQAAAHYLQGDFDRALKFWQDLLGLDPEDERAMEGVRLCEMLAEEASLDRGEEADLAPHETPVSLPVAGFNPPAPLGPDRGLDDEDLGLDLSALNLVGDLPPIDAAGPEPAGCEDAASELRFRVDELVLEVTRSYEAGDHETARATLDRIFILDETNEAALRIEAMLLAESHAQAEMPPALSIELPDPEWGAAAEKFDAAAVEAEPAPMTETIAGRAAAAAMPSLSEMTPAAPAKRSRRVAVGRPRVIVIVAISAALLMGASWFALRALGPGADYPEMAEAVPRTPALEPAGPDEAASGGATAGAPTGKPRKGKKGKKDAAEVEPATPPVVSPEEIPALLGQSRDAMDSGDYAAAIIVLDRVLLADPANAEARDELEGAAELYRAQQEYEDKMARAAAAWDRGDYTATLRIVYRLPQADGDPGFDRIKRDGWYNLVVQALREADCTDAVAHAKEVASLAPQDPDTRRLSELAATCGYSSRDAEWRAAVAGFATRAFSD